jgi:hypothetical protein
MNDDWVTWSREVNAKLAHLHEQLIVFEEVVAKVMATLRKEIRAEINAVPRMTYKGVWSEDTAYGEGDTVTDHGGIWYARAASIGARPGSGNPAWTLCVRNGRNGKDGRDLR